MVDLERKCSNCNGTGCIYWEVRLHCHLCRGGQVPSVLGEQVLEFIQKYLVVHVDNGNDPDMGSNIDVQDLQRR